jgi:hypothetical protein
MPSLPQSTLASGDAAPSLGLAVLAPLLAGGMGWGIRGQYGHETGAMIAGVLVGLVLVLLHCPRATRRQAGQAVALTALGISFGGCLTYGQTLGLTQDPALVGNWEALRWGMLGLALKGGAWVGLAGGMLGMALGGQRYRALEAALLMLLLIGLMLLGIYVVNQPFDPAARQLPRFYFSADWHWLPDAADLRPRFEKWGGLWAALIGLACYVGVIRRDRLAWRMTLWGTAAGAIGFPAGQCIQAYHAWNREAVAASFLGPIAPLINWWNMMEITFGAILGAGLGLGLWLNRRWIGLAPNDDQPELRPSTEWTMLVLHALAVVAWNFVSFAPLDHLADLALTMGLVPLVGIVGGRYWPWMFALPIVALPICGKTLRQMCYESTQVGLTAGWLGFVAGPLIALTLAAWYASRSSGAEGRSVTRLGLLLTTWCYFGLNFAFFDFPWPWRAATGRTPSAAIFTVCAAGLTLLALAYDRRPRSAEAATTHVA